MHAELLQLELRACAVDPIVRSCLRALEPEAQARKITLEAQLADAATARCAPEKVERTPKWIPATVLTMELPAFRYHPDPVGTGSVQASDQACLCCGERRGYIYVGPVFAEDELDEAVCPWCIADGSAHERFEAEFTDAASVGLGWDDVTPGIVEEVAFRTPGFTGWQQERWFTHCGDAAAFLGQADREDLHGKWADAVASIRGDAPMSDEQWQGVLDSLAKGPPGSPTAYVFRCLDCGQLGGYWDSH